MDTERILRMGSGMPRRISQNHLAPRPKVPRKKDAEHIYHAVPASRPVITHPSLSSIPISAFPSRPPPASNTNYDSQKALFLCALRRVSTHALLLSTGRERARFDLQEWKMAAAARLSQKVRHFSTSLVRPVSKLVQPPIQVYGLEGRYATALYSAASKQKKLDQMEKELTRVMALMKDPKLSGIVMNPHIKGAVKQKAVNDAVLKEKLSPITVNFVNVLAENGRLRYTPGVISAFGKIMSAYRGEVLCSVTTAQPLDEASLTELKTALNGFLAKGEILKLEVKTDPSILGGMIVGIGEKYVDMSTKTKIQKLSKIMKETI